MAFKIITVES